MTKFQQIFLSVMFLTLLSGGTAFGLANKKTLSEQQNRIFETATMTWNMGVGVIFGLLGGKSITESQNKDSSQG